jgi:arginyl-tRNA synthetase
MPDVERDLESALREALAAETGLSHEEAAPQLRPATDPAFGDYQSNAAMALGKRLGENPRELAQRVVDRAALGDACASVEVAGPGFINLRLGPRYLAARLEEIAAAPRLGVPPAATPRSVVLDYSSPNVAKQMHVGHLRSTVIGDALARVLAFAGHEVIPQNHIGDWGTQFGMLIEHLAERGETDLQGYDLADLASRYQAAQERFEADASFAERARERVRALQEGDPDTRALWGGLVAASQRHFRAVYEKLGVQLTDAHVRGESFYNDKLPEVVAALHEKGLLQESQGASVVFPEGLADREGNPLPMIVRKSDGGYLYATTDLAAARYRIETLGTDWLIYVTDARQSQHFAMLFTTLRAAGWAPEDAVRLDHVTFGTILGSDRKPFKTRAGGTVRLMDLLEEAERRAADVLAEKNPDLPEAERAEVARRVGLGALKYGDLATDRTKDYVFDWNRMLAFDGNTAPYLQNAYVRIRSIFRRGGLDPDAVPRGPIVLEEEAEHALALHLLQFPRAVGQVVEKLEPHRLCQYLYDLAGHYHQFYEHCPVLPAEPEARRASRLALCNLTAQTLAQGLNLLGIETVERM